MTDTSTKSANAVFRLGYRAWVGLGYVLMTMIAISGVAMEFRQIDENIATLARERGSVLFRLVELTRDWNAQHGGVYVRVTEKTQPNPYLKVPQRDLETVDGIKLTMVNPSFMTRQIAEIAELADGVKYHITSLKPIRPANVAEPWEAKALTLFEQADVREVLELVQTDNGPVHRYMAPLLVKQPCLKCHAVQGYSLGEVRGGISVSMPAAKALAVRDAQRQRSLLIFGLSGLAIALLMHLVSWRSRRHFLRLHEVSAGQERLILERTRELSEANRRLLDEVAERQRKEMQISNSEARYRSVIETSQNAVVIVQAPDFRILFANERAGEMLGLRIEEILDKPYSDFIHPQDRQVVAERLARRMRGEPVTATGRFHFARADGSHLRVGDVHIASIERADGQPQWVVSISDVTDRLSNERALQIAAAVMENAAEGIVVTDSRNHIIQVNPAFTAITGYRPQEVLGKNPRVLASGRHDAAFFASMWKSLDDSGHWSGELWNRRPDGTVYVVWLAISTIQGESLESGGRHVATFIDITQRKEVEELLRHKAHSDPLTDLPNRSLFYDRLQMVANQARRYDESFALFYLDLDHFKAVNDTMGHAAGDELLIEASRRLTLAVRESDTVARLGGDEFAVILPKIGSQGEVEEVAQRVVEALAQPFALHAGEAHVSASVGIAIFPEHGLDLSTLRANADAALYAVKQSGRNNYRVHVPGANLGGSYGLLLGQ